MEISDKPLRNIYQNLLIYAILIRQGRKIIEDEIARRNYKYCLKFRLDVTRTAKVIPAVRV